MEKQIAQIKHGPVVNRHSIGITSNQIDTKASVGWTNKWGTPQHVVGHMYYIQMLLKASSRALFLLSSTVQPPALAARSFTVSSSSAP